MPENNDQAGAPKVDTPSPTPEAKSDRPNGDGDEMKDAADKGENTSVLPDPDEEGSALEEIDDSLVNPENS